MKDIVIANKYILLEKIGMGKFGIVYKGIHRKTQQNVAIKMEKRDQEIATIKHETIILNHLYRKGCRDVPFVLWYGVYMEYTCLAMTYFEKTLSEIKDKLVNEKEKINKIMYRLLDIIENVHEHYVIHRDIKIENFMILENEIFIIDFGLATFYIDENNEHIQYKKREYITGTPKYISINIHNGIEPSRRDDLISIGYVYLYLYYGNLPWNNIPNVTKMDALNEDSMHILNRKNMYIKEKKELHNIMEYAINCGCDKYMDYCYNLKYTEKPNYTILKNMFL
jgi:serine/threonine protein kinase